jgi:hypothetical protein
MKHDFYTKAVLTIIAVALSDHCAESLDRADETWKRQLTARM